MAYQTTIHQVLAGLRALLDSDVSEELRQLVEELIDRLEHHLRGAPVEIHPDLSALVTELLEALYALLASIEAYLRSLENDSPEEKGKALADLKDCLARVEAALTALERALRPKPPKPS